MKSARSVYFGLAAFVWMPLTAWPQALSIGNEPGEFSQFNQAQTINRDISYLEPVEVHPGKSSTSLNLVVRESINLINGIELRHRSYNGGLVGPTIRVNPGKNLCISLRNMLRPESNQHTDSEGPAIGPHGYNTTNLHTHGLHVSPESPADDVFKEIRPGETVLYNFEIPKDHPAGTFWYHAHKHGSTALQLASGMSGALIVTGGLDDAPVIRDAKEKIMVLQQFTFAQPDGEPAFVDPDLVYSGKGDVLEAINGVVTPTIVMRPGEVQRWRIIHAGTTELINLDIEGVNFHEIAVDGLATGKIVLRNKLQLYPGYRSDVLVKAPEAQTERLMTSEIRDAQVAIRESITARRNLLKLVIEGEPKPMRLPTDDELAPYAAFTPNDVPTDIAKTRKITFSSALDESKFYVNGQEFDPNEIKQTMELDTSEEWEIESADVIHPFHIHVNPFAVRRKGTSDPWVWRDTIAVRRGRPLLLRTTYRKFTGKTVLHCHNLRHEDLGMMQAIEIVKSNETTEQESSAESRPVAPDWEAKTMEGFKRSSKNFLGRPLLVVLHRGMNCLHCARQLFVLSENYHKFVEAGIEVVAISQFLPSDKDALDEITQFEFEVLVDEELRCFERFNCIGNEGVPNHGLFLITPDNEIVYEKQTEIAVTSPLQLIDQVINSLPVKGSD